MAHDKRIMVFSGSANPELARRVTEYLGISVCKARLGRFADGEISACIDESVRGQDVYLIASMANPVNDHLMEVLICLDAMKRASAGSVTAVLPYYPYARQDRQDAPRRPITAKLVADLVTAAGASRVMSVDLHTGQIQGFFSIPVEHLHASPVLVSAVREIRDASDVPLVMVSPDAGGVERTRHYCNKLELPLAIIDKRRSGPNVAEVMHVIGDVHGKVAVLIDDIIDTAGTLTQAAVALREHGAHAVYAAAAHPVLSGPAVERISNSVLEQVFVTDTIPLSEGARECAKLDVRSVGELIGEAITRVHVESSVSSMFR